MNAAARAELLRSRFKGRAPSLASLQPSKPAAYGLFRSAAGGASPDAANAAPRVSRQSLARPSWKGWANSAAPFGTEASKRHQAQWIDRPDDKPRCLTLSPARRGERQQALNRIAEQLPAKLPRVEGWDRARKPA